MRSHFMAAPTRQEMGCADRAEGGQCMSGPNDFGQSTLTTEQQARLDAVMARQAAAGGGHLSDGRHLGDMPDYRPC